MDNKILASFSTMPFRRITLELNVCAMELKWSGRKHFFLFFYLQNVAIVQQLTAVVYFYDRTLLKSLTKNTQLKSLKHALNFTLKLFNIFFSSSSSRNATLKWHKTVDLIILFLFLNYQVSSFYSFTYTCKFVVASRKKTNGFSFSTISIWLGWSACVDLNLYIFDYSLNILISHLLRK